MEQGETVSRQVGEQEIGGQDLWSESAARQLPLYLPGSSAAPIASPSLPRRVHDVARLLSQQTVESKMDKVE